MSLCLKLIFPKGFENNLAILLSNVEKKEQVQGCVTHVLKDSGVKISKIYNYNNSLLSCDFTKLPPKPNNRRQVQRDVTYFEDAEDTFFFHTRHLGQNLR